MADNGEEEEEEEEKVVVVDELVLSFSWFGGGGGGDDKDASAPTPPPSSVDRQMKDDDKNKGTQLESRTRQQLGNGPCHHCNELREAVRRIAPRPSPPPSLRARRSGENGKEVSADGVSGDVEVGALAAAADLRRRSELVKSHMGTMAQCRGKNGDDLREAGAIDALLSTLDDLLPFPSATAAMLTASQGDAMNGVGSRTIGSGEARTAQTRPVVAILPPVRTELQHRGRGKFEETSAAESSAATGSSSDSSSEAAQEAAIELAIVCLGALRDLSCGSAANRIAVRDYRCRYRRVRRLDGIDGDRPCFSPSHSSLPLSSSREEDDLHHWVGDGIALLSEYVRRYHGSSWEDILSLPHARYSAHVGALTAVSASNGAAGTIATAGTATARGKRELRLCTNAIGAVRNVAHSTPANCNGFNRLGVTDLLVWRLLRGSREQRHQNQQQQKSEQEENDERHKEALLSPSSSPSPSLPAADVPWREASYRCAGTLINIAERCPGCADVCGSNAALIRLLVEAWGGASAVHGLDGDRKDEENEENNTRGKSNVAGGGGKGENGKAAIAVPPLHLGLAAVLVASEEKGTLLGREGEGGGRGGGVRLILDREEKRKEAARRREEERKRRAAAKKRTARDGGSL